MRKRFNPGRRTAGPAAYGRYGVPTVPLPIPIFAAAALLAAFSFGRKSERLRQFGGGPWGHKSRRFVGPRAAGCGPHSVKGPPTGGEETVRV
jgi:hypothetical protein